MNEEPMILLKFSGKELDIRSIPIYELGDTLMAIQRIVHKAHLFESQRLRKGAQLTQEERMRISLQISERRKSSDVYALIPFLSDPAIQGYLASLLKIGLGALAKYALMNVLGEKSRARDTTAINAPDSRGSVFVGAIHAETVQIHNHINNIGSVEKIELISSTKLGVAPIILDQNTQSYVRDIATQRISGEVSEIVGYVTRLYPSHLSADIKLAPARFVKVHLTEDAFRFVRYETETEQNLKFVGRPIVRLGTDMSSYQDFEAESVELAHDH